MKKEKDSEINHHLNKNTYCRGKVVFFSFCYMNAKHSEGKHAGQCLEKNATGDRQR